MKSFLLSITFFVTVTAFTVKMPHTSLILLMHISDKNVSSAWKI